MLFNIISLLALVAVTNAFVPPEGMKCPHIKCIDGVNRCGIKYGRCYDMCKSDMPSPPPCPETPTLTTSPPIVTTSVPSACTSTGTACVDYFRTCGSPATATVTYGGCFPACGPTPTYSAPACPEPTEVTEENQ